MRAIVCGGRDFADRQGLWDALESFQNSEGRVTALAHGAAPGADSMAAQWARDNGVPVVAYPAKWKTEGRAAGPLRNQRMIDDFRPDVVLAFSGGRGTADMIRRADVEGVRVVKL